MTFQRALRGFIPAAFAVIATATCLAGPAHDKVFWQSIHDHAFAVPAGESAGRLTLEIADLAASTDPVLRDTCGYEILAAWIYRDHRVDSSELEALRKKLMVNMVHHLGDFDNDTIFERSFSALYMSILAAEDLTKPFLSPTAFRETLDCALRCYAEEKDLRGYVPDKGWAHATAHVADLLKFLGRNDKLSPEMQKQIVVGVAQRARAAGSVFVWGEDARMAAALLSLADRKDFDAVPFNDWFAALIAENKALWKSEKIDPKTYAAVRVQANVLAHLSAKIAAQKKSHVPTEFRDSLSATLQVD